MHEQRELEIATKAAKRLTELRVKHLKVGQAEMAAIAGVQVAAFSKYESGRITQIPRATWEAIAKHAGVSVAWLMGLSDLMREADATIPFYNLKTGESGRIPADPGLDATISIQMDESMDLLLPTGSLVWFRAISDPEDGDIVAVRLWDNSILVRRFRRVNLMGRVLWPESRTMNIDPMIIGSKSESVFLGVAARMSIDM